jgi:hypothetical protein
MVKDASRWPALRLGLTDQEEIVARFNATPPGIGEGIAAPINVNVNIVWLDTEQDLGD